MISVKQHFDIEKIYELLWMVGELDTWPFTEEKLTCGNSDCIDCEKYFGCESVLNLSKPFHPMRKNPLRFYPKEDNFACMLDLLPSEIVDKIFQYCSHKDLMTLSRSFPQFIRRIMSQSLWRDLEFDFDDRYFSGDELLMLLDYLNGQVRSLCFDEWTEMSVELFRRIVELVPNLTSIKLGKFRKEIVTDILNILVVKLPNLKKFHSKFLSGRCMNDEQMKLLERLTKIESIHIGNLIASKDAIWSLFNTLSNLNTIDIGYTKNCDFE